MERIERDKAIEEYYWLVPALVKKFFRNVPPWVESFMDLCSVGTIGLVDAADRWDESKKQSMSFKNWACRRIVGSILDELQKQGRRKVSIPLDAFQLMYVHQIAYPDIEYETKNLRKYVRVILSVLTAKERLVIIHVYLHGMSQRDVGYLLGLSESRISQVIAKCRKLVVAKFGSRPEFMNRDDAYFVRVESISKDAMSEA